MPAALPKSFVEIFYIQIFLRDEIHERINNLKRIPVPAPGTVFDKKKNAPRKKKWDEED